MSRYTGKWTTRSDSEDRCIIRVKSACGDLASLCGSLSINDVEFGVAEFADSKRAKKLSEKPLSYESLYLNGACVLFGAMRLSRSWIPRIRIMHSLESVRRS